MPRPHPSLMDLARLGSMSPPSDLDVFLESTREHRMTGLVWSSVERGEIDLPDAAARMVLQEDMANGLHHHRLWDALDRILDRLEASGIGVVSFKGVTDEQRWFNRPGERPCSDIDLLIDDAQRFDEAVAALDPGHPLIGAASRTAARGQAFAVDLWFDGVLVDLHVDPIKVGSGWRHPESWLRRTRDLTAPSGRTLRVFDDEATAALRLLHLGRDRFRYLLWLVEVRRILESGVDWEAVLSLARDEGIEAPVAVAARVVADELGGKQDLTLPNGWRVKLWERMWKPEVRLLGELGRRRYVRRSAWLLPLTMPGRTVESLLWLIRTAVPPAVLFDLKHPGGKGPYPWRLIERRASYLIRRRLRARTERR